MKKKAWIEGIKAAARADGWTDTAIERTDWEGSWESYGASGMTPANALAEEYSYA